MADKNLSILSLCQKAGKVASGEFGAESSIKSGRAWLVVVAGDASENTKKKFRNMAAFYQVRYVVLSDKDTLGALLGKAQRSVLTIEDQGMAKAFAQKNQISFDSEGGNGKG